MSFVEAVRTKHEIETAVRELLGIASIATIEEIELAIAHLADDQAAGIGHPNLRSLELKGQLLTAYLDARKSGELKQRKISRALAHSKKKEFFRKQGLAKHQSLMSQYKAKVEERKRHTQKRNQEYESRVMSWKMEQKSKRFWQRLFSLGTGPTKPAPLAMVPLPPDSQSVVRTAVERGTTEEFVIEFIREFEFPFQEIPEVVPNYTVREFEELSGEK